QHKQYGPRSRGELVAQSNRADLEVGLHGIAIGMFLFDRLVHGIELGASGWQIHPRCEPREQFGHAMYSACNHGCRKMMRAGHDVGDDLSLLRIRNAWLQDTHDSGGARISKGAEPNSLTDHRR